MKKLLLSAIVASIVHGHAMAADADTKKKTVNEKHVENIRILGSTDGLRADTGSATFIDETELEKFEYDDINRILAKVPGVNIRQEDGYGLRPNIGFRGATPERSKKIALMEDGILIAPAPYSASAAYYFPQVSRMTGVEVFKGPASIKYGPNTVAGALNLTTRAIPNGSEGGLDIAAGSDGYKKYHVHYGNTNGDFGYLIEALNVSADGFKELDSGDDTGFDKNSFMAKFNYDLSTDSLNQLVELKLGYDDELSHESYVGLTDADFEKTPNRRYSASQNDLMDWEHSNALLTHFMETDEFSLTTRAYYNKFERSWNKLNGFNFDNRLEDIIADPTNTIYADFVEVLKGERDSENARENLVLGDNAREYYSWGVQSDFAKSLNIAGIEHQLEIGIRYHVDEIERKHTVDYFAMTNGQLVKTTTNEPEKTTFNTEESKALSVYIQDTITLDALTITAGVRGEYIDSTYQNTFKANDWLTKESRIWLPGVSAFYKFNNQLGFLMGVNKGYVPTSPQQDPQIKPEESVNYELGLRYSDDATNAEVVAFFNDYSNLKESCTFSASANCSVVDTEYNAGEVDIYGLEATASHTITLTDNLDLPLSAVYTYSQSEFKESFVSDFALWGNVTAGDEVPYLAEHQITLTAELTNNNWQAAVLVKYIGEMKEAAGTGVNFEGVNTEALTVVDFSGSYDINNGEHGSVYLKVDNIFEAVESVSHRPYGARPSKPRQAVLGYKYAF
jgi:Fe(3+) dicitrate transport protein